VTGRRRWATPDRYTLPVDLVDAAAARASALGCSVEDVIADALAEQLPSMVGEALTRALPAAVRRARPVDVSPEPAAIT